MNLIKSVKDDEYRKLLQEITRNVVSEIWTIRQTEAWPSLRKALSIKSLVYVLRNSDITVNFTPSVFSHVIEPLDFDFPSKGVLSEKRGFSLLLFHGHQHLTTWP